MAPEITVVSMPKGGCRELQTTAFLTTHKLRLRRSSSGLRTRTCETKTFLFYPTRAILSIIYVRLCTYRFVSDRMYAGRNALSPSEPPMKMGAVPIRAFGGKLIG